MLEFDQVNSFHLHGNVFEYYPSGTSTTPSFVNDILTLGQGDRGIPRGRAGVLGPLQRRRHRAEEVTAALVFARVWTTDTSVPIILSELASGRLALL